MKMNSKRSAIPALNFHLWQPCNMRCRYCFAGFDSATERLRAEKAHLQDRAEYVVRAAAAAGIRKLTFVGGEPLLCPWLTELLTLANRLGMVTMVVSNGSRMSPGWIAEHAGCLGWAALSIDSLSRETNCRLGRVAHTGFVPDRGFYRDVLQVLARRGVRTKINTVVSSLNWEEDFTDFLRDVRPERWKVLQALHVKGENDRAFPALAVTVDQFASFVQRHADLAGELMLAPEDNDAMLGSYLMVDPLGRFFTNADGSYAYSAPIWEVGWDQALKEVQVSEAKFIHRGGLYDWGAQP